MKRHGWWQCVLFMFFVGCSVVVVPFVVCAQEVVDRDKNALLIDENEAGGVISPLLFGQNVDHARRSFAGGLSAQLLVNRKFSGPAADGIAWAWGGVGVSGAVFALDPHEPYACPYSQRIVASAKKMVGIHQKGFFLGEGNAYEVRLQVKSSRAIVLRVCVRSGERVHVEKTFMCEPGGWRTWAFCFVGCCTDNASVLELTFDGPGEVWVGAVSLIPRDTVLGMRRDVIACLKEMSAPLLRWPCGDITRDYDWRGALQPLDRRVPGSVVSAGSRVIDDGDIATGEFLELCRVLGAEPAITVSLNPDRMSPADAAAWVEYCNGDVDSPMGSIRAQQGHAAPYAVKYWFLGDEAWNDLRAPAHFSADGYVACVAGYVAAMKKVDPSIVLVASGYCAQMANAVKWNCVVVKGLKDRIDLLSVHACTPIDDAQYSQKSLLQNLRHIRRSLEDVDLAGCTTRLALDAWNPLCLVAPSQVGEGRDGDTSSNALRTALILNLFCRQAQLLGVEQAAYLEPINQGGIAVLSGRAALTATGQVFALFQAHQGNRVVPIRNVSARSDVDITASLDQDEHHILITTINRNAAEDRLVKLRFGRQYARVHADVHVLFAKQDSASERFEEQDNEIPFLNGYLHLTTPARGIALLTVDAY